MHKYRVSVFFFALSVMAVSLVGFAQIDVHIASYLVQVDAQTGKETLVVSDTAQPGDVIEYVVEATNTAQTEVEGLVLVGPVPAPTKLLPAWYQAVIDFLAGKTDAPVFCVITLKDGDPQTILMSTSKLPKFSLDNGETYSSPPVTYVVNGERKQATSNMFTHIRWTIDVLKPGDSVKISYRVVVP
jgi:uncharacterized repeat protein (TIGR01451 family)